MRWTRFVLGVGGLFALAGGTCWAAGPYAAPCPTPYGPGHYLAPGCPQPFATPQLPGQQPGQPPPDQQPAVPADAFAQAPEAGTQAAESYNPNMFGDLIGPIGMTTVNTGRFRQVSRGGTLVSVPITRKVRVPLASRGAFKIADNESPRPVDRIFVNYNYFNNVFGSLNPGVPSSDVHRETIGFEKTFFDRNASFGIRLPFLQFNGFDGAEDSQVGDLTFILKYAFLNNRENGNIVSGGLAVTAPTGESPVLLDDLDVHSTLIQPWGGFILNSGSIYVQGFSSLVIPTDSRDVTLWFNDIGIGFWAYRNNARDSLITAIVPTIEAHINTPLNHRGSESTPIGFIDAVNMTGGINWVFRNRIQIGTAVAFPLTGPQPFDIEALANLNIRF